MLIIKALTKMLEDWGEMEMIFISIIILILAPKKYMAHLTYFRLN